MHRSSRSSAQLALACALLAPLVPASAWAQPPEAAAAPDGAAAVKLAQEGRAAYDAGRWDEAHDLFARAQAAADSPVFELYMARARRQAGKLTQARALYLRVAQRKIDDGAPPSWAQARLDAQAELAVLLPRIPSVVVAASGGQAGVTARVDARPVRIGETVDVDPGEHVVAWSGRAGSGERRITVAEGERGVRVEVGDGARSAATPGAATPAGEGEGTGASEGSLVPGVVGLSVGGATLAVGAVLGIVALGADADASGACPGGRCPTSAELTAATDDQDRAGTFADVSTVLFVAGSVFTAAGVVLLVVRPGGGGGDDVALRVGPTGASLRGGF